MYKPFKLNHIHMENPHVIAKSNNIKISPRLMMQEHMCDSVAEHNIFRRYFSHQLCRSVAEHKHSEKSLFSHREQTDFTLVKKPYKNIKTNIYQKFNIALSTNPFAPLEASSDVSDCENGSEQGPKRVDHTDPLENLCGSEESPDFAPRTYQLAGSAVGHSQTEKLSAPANQDRIAAAAHNTNTFKFTGNKIIDNMHKNIKTNTHKHAHTVKPGGSAVGPGIDMGKAVTPLQPTTWSLVGGSILPKQAQAPEKSKKLTVAGGPYYLLEEKINYNQKMNMIQVRMW